MNFPIQIPAVWVYTTGDFNRERSEGYPDFFTDAQKSRIERIRQARLLFDGKHKQYFLEEGRTQFDFPESRVGTRQISAVRHVQRPEPDQPEGDRSAVRG